MKYRPQRTFAALAGIALACAAGAPSAAQLPPAPVATRPSAEAEGIVVTARRSGIPVWHVVGPTTTIVLVGSIRSVAAGTRWDPAPLEAALLKADLVMFPESAAIRFGLFSGISALRKFLAQRTLPKGQTLQAMMTPEQFGRLVALRNRGVLKAGFERSHPLHLAHSLGSATMGKGKGGIDPGGHVRRVARKNKLKMVPSAQADAKAVTAELFGSAPRAHVPCLMDAVALAEAGSGAIKARSDAWAERRVPAALASVAWQMERSCWPAGSRLTAGRSAALSGTVRGLLAQPKVTLAVISLDSLAERGGVLDDLVAAGFDVRGPKWRP